MSFFVYLTTPSVLRFQTAMDDTRATGPWRGVEVERIDSCSSLNTLVVFVLKWRKKSTRKALSWPVCGPSFKPMTIQIQRISTFRLRSVVVFLSTYCTDPCESLVLVQVTYHHNNNTSFNKPTWSTYNVNTLFTSSCSFLNNVRTLPVLQLRTYTGWFEMIVGVLTTCHTINLR